MRLHVCRSPREIPIPFSQFFCEPKNYFKKVFGKRDYFVLLATLGKRKQGQFGDFLKTPQIMCSLGLLPQG
jgi:hypothetical protein